MALGAIANLVSRNQRKGLEDLVASLFHETPVAEGCCPCGCKGGSVSLRESWKRPLKARRLVSAHSIL